MKKSTRWLGRLAASLILVMSILVFGSATDTGSVLLFALAALGLGGAVLFIFGLERPTHRLARGARALGWMMMLGFSLIPTSFLLLPALVVLLAFPAVLTAGVIPGTATSAFPARRPS
jgi:hypothetical protein